jgi:hypothetical protein
MQGDKMKTFKDYLAEEEYDRQRDADAESGKPRKLSVGSGGGKPKGYSKEKAEKAAMDNVKKVLAKEGGMSDVMIGVDELISDFTNQGDKESGLKMPKAEVIQSIKDSGSDPMEIKFAIDTINSEFDMDGNYKYSGYDETMRMKELAGIETEAVVGGNARPIDPDSVFARLGNDIQSIMNDALDGNDMADDIADELGDYLRNGEAPEGSHYEKAIQIVMSSIHDGPQAQAEAAEEAISVLHSEEKNPKFADEDVGEGRYDGPNSSCCDAPIKNYENGMGICSACGDHASPHEDEEDVDELARIRELANIDEETYDGDDFYEAYGDLWFNEDDEIDEAEYQGRKVKLGKPMQGDVKKFKVYVKNPKGNIVKVNFGDPDMKIKKSNPARRRSFRARHNCDNPGPRHKARYWSCRKW